MATVKPQIPIIDWSNSITSRLKSDFPIFEGAGKAPINIVTKAAGTYVNSPTWTYGLPGRGMLFTKASSQGITYTENVISSINNWTMEALVVPSASQSPNFGMIFYNGDDGAGAGIGMGGSSGGAGSNFVVLFGGVAWVDSTVALTVGVPNHLVFTKQAGVDTFYINGRQQGAIPATDYSSNTANKAGIGIQTSVDGRYFDGKIFYCRSWDRVLTKTEIKNLYLNPWQIYKQMSLNTSRLFPNTTPPATPVGKSYLSRQAVQRGAYY